jgi:hypothetical protein
MTASLRAWRHPLHLNLFLQCEHELVCLWALHFGHVVVPSSGLTLPLEFAYHVLCRRNVITTCLQHRVAGFPCSFKACRWPWRHHCRTHIPVTPHMGYTMVTFGLCLLSYTTSRGLATWSSPKPGILDSSMYLYIVQLYIYIICNQLHCILDGSIFGHGLLP